MSRETEKVFKELDKFLADKEIESEEQAQALMEQFMTQYNASSLMRKGEITPETADDYLELAEGADTKKMGLKYAKKALELEPDNLDAEVMVAELSSSNFEQMIEKYQTIIVSATEKLKKEGYFQEEYIGDFWGVLETRPYMRLLDKYASLLVNTMRIREAMKQYEEMLRLCENDNLGARYRLIHLYVYFEDEQAALALYNQYEQEDSTQFLLPLSMLYYKKMNLKESLKYLKLLKKANKDTQEFFQAIINYDMGDYLENRNPFGYRPFTIEEFLVEMEENHFILASMASYYDWALKKMKNMK